MRQAKVLLLNFNPTGSLGSTFRNILESSAGIIIQVQQESVEIGGLTSWGSNLSRSILHFNPDLISLVLPSILLKQAGALFQSLREEARGLPIIVVIEAGEPDEMFGLLKLGAADFIIPPLRAIDVLPRIWRLLEQTRRGETLTHTLKEDLGLNELVGESPAFRAEIKKIPLVARCDASVLISGETGTGKELCARAIHYLSPRTSKPFVPVNCGAIPVELMENELFGHERGAFTGASGSQPGLIHEANGGTLFLDEIDCLSLPAQVKLLRFLQEKEYRRLGSTKIRQADVRVIAATNLNLEAAVREGRLRRDLYYRLNIIPLTLPPLRARREDILLLARYFLAKYADEFNKKVTDLSSDAVRELMLYDWPGNVRELEHVVQRAVVLSEEAIIQSTGIALISLEVTARQESFQEAKARTIAQFERAYIQESLLAYQGNISKAAQAAHKDRRTFGRLIRKYCIDVRDFKPGAL